MHIKRDKYFNLVKGAINSKIRYCYNGILMLVESESVSNGNWKLKPLC
jgi:hypothetical protein